MGAKKDKKHVEDSKVFVGGLPWSVDEETVRSDFAKFGNISRFNFRRDKEGRPVGEARIFYDTQETVEKVLLLDGIEYKGRAIKVKRRSPRRRSGKKTRAALSRMQRHMED